MKKKLTLTIEENISRRAKRYAKKKGISVSELVENYLNKKIGEETEWEPQDNSWTKRLTGILSTDNLKKYENDNIKKLKEKAILEKYVS